MQQFFVRAKGSSFYNNLDKVEQEDELEMKWGTEEYPHAIQLSKAGNILGVIPRETAEKMFYFKDKQNKQYKCFLAKFNEHEGKRVGFNIRVEVK